jgi:hypothetical protein
VTAFLASVAILVPAPNVATGVGHIPVDHRPAVVAPYRARLQRIARCESGSRWHIATGNGFYGGLQVLPSTWWAVGGRGYPQQASALEQMYRAVKIMRMQGWGAWPHCQYA